MIKLNRTTEYGLIALKFMAVRNGSNLGGRAVTSAREVSDLYGLPFEITAKTLQRLKDTGLIQSEQGAKGGYVLAKDLEEVSLAEFIGMMEGPISVVHCAQGASGSQTQSCEYQGKCEMTDVMRGLNSRIETFLKGIKLSELTRAEATLQVVQDAAAVSAAEVRVV